MGRTILVLVMLAALAGCSRLTPGDPGLTGGYPLTGQTIKTASGTRVSFTDGLGFTCSGPFAASPRKKTVTTKISCGDGRSGIAVVHLGIEGAPLTAVLRFERGSEEKAVFGPSVSFPAEAAGRPRGGSAPSRDVR